MLTHPSLSVPPALQEKRAELLVRLEAGEAMLHDQTLLPDASSWRQAYVEAYREWHETQHNPARFTAYRTVLAGDALRSVERLEQLNSRPFPQGKEMRTSAAEELNKHCTRDGNLPTGEVVCPQCRLRWGERLALRSPRDIEGIANLGIAALRLALREAPVRSFLSRHPEGQQFLQWNELGDGECESLLPLLSDKSLALLNESMRPRRQVTRSLDDLAEQFRACYTRGDFTAAFAQWLDGNEHLSDIDEIILQLPDSS